MIRTREFLLFFATAGLLLVAITVTWVSGIDRAGPQAAQVSLPEPEESTEFTVADSEFEDRRDTAAEIASMRERIAAFRDNGGVDTDRFVVADEPVRPSRPTTTAATSSVATGSVEQCSTYSAFSGAWPRDVRVEEREGARLVYVAESVPATAASATSTPVDETEQILLQLPVHTSPRIGEYCVESDVVGVAQDGSLIRNSEYDLYGVFTDETTVGYALDGYPIFGRNDSVAVDECGGAVVNGEYGYVLQSDRESVVQCFRSQPVALPTS